MWSRNRDITIKNGKTKQNQTETCLVQAIEAEGLAQSNRNYKRRNRETGPKQHDKRRCPELRIKDNGLSLYETIDAY